MAPGPVFYPKYLDISVSESALFLRQIELEAYAGIISALRSQGDLTKEKKALLTEICACLGIGDDRHRAEIRRAVNDEKLSTIALHNSGSELSIEWIKEGRRLVSLPHRPLQITPYMDEANRVAEILAAENAALPQPSTVRLNVKKPKTDDSEPIMNKPQDLSANISTRYDSSIFCAKCLSLLNKTVDEETSTEDLNPNEAKTGLELSSAEVPSASDSYVYLPSGTRVCVAHGRIDKEDVQDAYSMKPSLADFGNAPDINLTGPRPTKRKRKKSSSSFQTKESGLTIKQVIKPNSKQSEIPLDELFSRNDPDRFLHGDDRIPKFSQDIKPEIHRYGKPTIRRKISDDSRQKYPHEPQAKSRKKKFLLQQSIPHDTIQHTPVPPEHLYAAGANTKLKQSQFEDPNATIIGSRPEYSVSTQQSPTKHLGQFSSRISPLSPSYYPPQGQLPWTSSSSSGVANRDLPTLTETNTTYSRGFRYSPTKAVYKPPNIVQNTYGKSPKAAKRYRPSGPAYSFTKKATQAEIDHQNHLKQLATRRDTSSTIRRASDDLTQATRMPMRPQLQSSGSYGDLLHGTDDGSNTMLLPILDSKTEDRTDARSSSLEELASVSVMASALNTSSIIETGLAPVSAIVSRVTSPAPGQLSSAPVARKSNKPMILSRIQSEEGGQPVRLIQQPIVGPGGAGVGSVRQGSTFVNLQSTTPINPTGAKIKNAGSIVSISGQHPTTHQVRLALSSPETNIPSIFSSSVPMSLPVSSPRVISTVSAKSHTLLKSTAGNVITVTAKSLPGMKAQPTLVSGTSVVKPQIGQKTSIIVVHKAPGSKLGKNAAGFQTISSDGSKVITVSTKNLTTPTIDLPRLPAESNEELATGSALGSIQGLVSGLNPTGLVKKTKVIGSKPKFVTMPIQKKTIIGKIGDTPRAKVIQNVIRAPGKVLVRTSSGSTLTTGQLRTITGRRIVKPVLAQTGGSVSQIIPTQTSQDIVAAALSHSLGASTVIPSSNQGKQELSPTVPGVIKVSTSTPAASTIKAFAANYQKNTSTAQIQMVNKSLSSITTISPSRQERPKVFLSTSPSQPKTQSMLFTPHQPQVHRSPQGPGHKGKPGTNQNVRTGVTIPQPTQHSMMKLKVIGTPQGSTLGPSANQWQSSKVKPEEDTAMTTDSKVFQEKSTLVTTSLASLPSTTLQSQSSAMNTGDRTTFIYQYHPNTSRSAPRTNQSTPMTPGVENTGDVIMLHTVHPNVDPKQSEEKRFSPDQLMKEPACTVTESGFSTTMLNAAPSGGEIDATNLIDED